MSTYAHPLAKVSGAPAVSPVPIRGRLLQRKCACGGTPGPTGECDECQTKQLQRKTRSPELGTQNDSTVPPIVHEVLRSPGQPLHAATRSQMEPHFGHDFSQVRIHADARAAVAASAIGARAFTSRRDIVFGTGEYAPRSAPGRWLLAHELAHVVQQSPGAPVPSGIGPVDDSWERHADAAANNLGLSPGRGPKDVGNIGPESRGIGLHTPNLGIRMQKAPDSPETPAKVLARELQTVIAGATWKEIRKRVYPKESAPGIERSKERSAGTRPELTGLGRLSTLAHFTSAIRAIQAKWTTLTPEKRVGELGGAANVELNNADVPEFLTVDKEPMEFKGFFSPSAWKYVMSEALVNNTTLNNEDAAEVSNTTLHESRHAEQHFLAARYSAGVNKKNAVGIAAEQGIPESIAKQAVAKKFDAKTDPQAADLGQRMYQADVTDANKNQAISDDDGIKELNKMRVAAQTSLIELNRNPSTSVISDAKAKRDDLRAQIIVVEKKYTLYRNIPYEADAHEVGDAATLAFNTTP